jgi:hypothetical protein
MKNRCFSLITACVFSLLLVAQTAEANNGTLTLTFKYKDSSGSEVPLVNAYVYLRDAGVVPPMEDFFSPPAFIFGPTDSTGFISVEVAAGKYFIRATRRNQMVGKGRPLGPPEPNDYTWTPLVPITINADAVTNLGTRFAGLFKQDIVVSGVITNASGQPLAGRYVRAQITPCTGDEFTVPNYCGPVKLQAFQRTDANGRYTLRIREGGTYYIVTSRTLGTNGRIYGGGWYGNPDTTGWSTGPINIGAGDKITRNIAVPANY